jgi:alkylation response protein AidB-like acyl-CoA dehydrogenase
VLGGHCADLLVVAARRGEPGRDGISLFAVPSETRGVERRALSTLDQTRRLAEIELHDVRVPASARLGEEGAGASALERILELAAIALAAEQVGGAQRSRSAVRTRCRCNLAPIGCSRRSTPRADMMLRVESARSAAYYAACVAAEASSWRAWRRSRGLLLGLFCRPIASGAAVSFHLGVRRAPSQARQWAKFRRPPAPKAWRVWSVSTASRRRAAERSPG